MLDVCVLTLETLLGVFVLTLGIDFIGDTVDSGYSVTTDDPWYRSIGNSVLSNCPAGYSEEPCCGFRGADGSSAGLDGLVRGACGADDGSPDLASGAASGAAFGAFGKNLYHGFVVAARSWCNKGPELSTGFAAGM